jgi:double-stranded uracil-DNA glycosylase
LISAFNIVHHYPRLAHKAELATVLRDVLDSGLYAVFCGTAVGTTSERQHAFYAHPGNRFWPILHETGLTPVLIRPANYRLIRRCGLGLTDLCKLQAGSDRSLNPAAYDIEGFKKKARDYAPVIVAFNGKKAAQIALAQRYVDFGLQRVGIYGAAVWVLPSTSGAATGFWEPVHWYALADAIRLLRSRNPHREG